MLRERLEAIQLLDYTLYVLFAYVWLIDSSFILLLLRMFTQIQLCSPSAVHPFFTLPVFGLILLWLTLICVFSHTWWDMGRIDPPSFFIDFIDRDHNLSRIQLVCIDLLIAFLQLLLVTLAFETQKRLTSDDLDNSTRPQASPGIIGHVPPRQSRAGYTSIDAISTSEFDEGQGWHRQDEEALAFTGQSSAGHALESRTSLTHPIAVFRVMQFLQDVWRTSAGAVPYDRRAGSAEDIPEDPRDLRDREREQLRSVPTPGVVRSAGRRIRPGVWLQDARQQMARFTPSWTGPESSGGSYTRIAQEDGQQEQ
ncbi:hypothetical protein K437DRAFT_272872 [Tilletiaria anomala UBC 951]|uniref:DUF1746 domain-containing protein n=1 Tax=Tilletiaria anomala (strain ATCC 24038 / CBS 436.72 / UBC 951) TaxID=1037660 RepID=A0A066WHN7_TILAU|nr:uncharacterized protein K437DRAFT_272872 [Tilletiaria anomala UBC 951]KDN52033.1 hypothetical protein K437DRAFT_272872 [Tilletiaria anomala UBC 951]